MPCKPGLSWRGVLLLQRFCPFCFKGKIGESNGTRVKSNSRHIDEVQALHAKNGNGLCLLDLQTPGEFCSNSSLCKLVCLVCGKAMLDGTDPEFEVFQNACSTDVEESDRPSRYELDDAMDEHDLVWTEQWDTPVHSWCAKKAPCKCMVPLGATMCPTHKRAVDPRCCQASSMPPLKKNVAKEAAPPARVATKVVLATATWLKPPSLMSKTCTSGGEPVKARTGGGRMAKPLKPNRKLETAAKNCSKINAWAVSRFQDATTTTGANEATGAGRAGFDLGKHQQAYDPYNPDHGYKLRKGVWTYGFPDGRVVPAGTVNEITADGRLIPLCY